MPVWQDLRNELHTQGFEVITVGCDVKGAEVEREYIEAARPEHPSLLDPTFIVPELYNTRNVPAVFWIDEDGWIVRGNDPVYATRRNRETGETTINERYLEAVRDWVRHGSRSAYLTSQLETQRRVGATDEANDQAMAHFRLGVHLDRNGHHEEAVAQFKAALALKPENWNYRRQAYNLGSADEYGITMQEAMQTVGPMYAMPLELPEVQST